MKNNLLVLLLICSTQISLHAQVGIGTSNPDTSSMLDVASTNRGVLVPRLTTAQRDAILNPATSLLIFNSSTQHFEFNSNTPAAPVWRKINDTPTVSADAENSIVSGTDAGTFINATTYTGKFSITATGSLTITGLPFQPTAIKFSANANVESYNVNADNGVGNNNNTFQNAFGTMQGYATNYSGSILQQVIYVGGNGASINDISRYASSTRAIGIRYSNTNGDNQGLTAAEITSFNTDGFTINVTNRTENIVVNFEAHR